MTIREALRQPMSLQSLITLVAGLVIGFGTSNLVVYLFRVVFAPNGCVPN